MVMSDQKVVYSLVFSAKLHSPHFTQWGSPSASDPRAKNTGQRATKGTVLTSQSLSPWCDCRRLGSTWASWRWQGINVGNPLWRRALLLPGHRTCSFISHLNSMGSITISGSRNYSNTQAFTVLPGRATHLLLGRENARADKVPSLGAHRQSIIQPSRGSNPRSLACKSCMPPLSHDAPPRIPDAVKAI